MAKFFIRNCKESHVVMWPHIKYVHAHIKCSTSLKGMTTTFECARHTDQSKENCNPTKSATDENDYEYTHKKKKKKKKEKQMTKRREEKNANDKFCCHLRLRLRKNKILIYELQVDTSFLHLLRFH